ncbi:MAG: hypothetical protein IPK16_08605 [Anaerolineales bacterium]|nr:hypothetical protein [Anaerolineales bacterium]
MSAGARLVLYGDSVFLAGLKAEFDRRSALDVVMIAGGCPGAAQRIVAFDPCAVLFDLCAEQPSFAIPLLYSCPNLMLIGVDPSSDQVLLLGGQRAAVGSAAAILQLAGIPGE